MNKQAASQETQLEFISASNNYYPYINSYSSEGGLKQFYLEDSKWVLNEAIPNFKNENNLKEISLQYITDGEENIPQLFVYSKTTGHFIFYFLTNDGWTINENIPSGKIEIDSDMIYATYTPSKNNVSKFIFSHSSDGSNIELLEIVENKWNPIKVFPPVLPLK